MCEKWRGCGSWSHEPRFLDSLKSKNKKLNTFCFSPTSTDPLCLLNIEMLCQPYALYFCSPLSSLDHGCFPIYLSRVWIMGPFLPTNTTRLQAPKIDEEVKKRKKIDETLSIINKPKHPKKRKRKRENTRNKMEGSTMSKKT